MLCLEKFFIGVRLTISKLLTYKNWRWWECLAHSRLTAIPSCASRLRLLQNSPASARSL